MAAVMVLFSLGGAHFPSMATNAGNATPYTLTTLVKPSDYCISAILKHHQFILRCIYPTLFCHGPRNSTYCSGHVNVFNGDGKSKGQVLHIALLHESDS